jgi:hypothetical protein
MTLPEQQLTHSSRQDKDILFTAASSVGAVAPVTNLQADDAACGHQIK